MPELPDLQVFSKNLNKRLKGKKVRQFSLLYKGKTGATEKEFKNKIEGEKIKNIYREGKQLFFVFGNGTVLGMHLMLHGDLHMEKEHNLKNVILELKFEDDTSLVLTDWQKAATPSLDPQKSDSPDALSPELNLGYLEDRLQGRAAIKNVLLDQKVIRGIGNAYADEILWEAGISPFSKANAIPKAKIKVLLKSIREVLKKAEKQILKKHPDIIRGEVRDFLKIHNAKQTHSPAGAKILTKVNGGRKTYYTAEQQLYT
jgi:formamidopyrimidine-DNA glycosylase